jgi:hypothetical protein
MANSVNTTLVSSQSGMVSLPGWAAQPSTRAAGCAGRVKGGARGSDCRAATPAPADARLCRQLAGGEEGGALLAVPHTGRLKLVKRSPAWSWTFRPSNQARQRVTRSSSGGTPSANRVGAPGPPAARTRSCRCGSGRRRAVPGSGGRPRRPASPPVSLRPPVARSRAPARPSSPTPGARPGGSGAPGSGRWPQQPGQRWGGSVLCIRSGSSRPDIARNSAAAIAPAGAARPSAAKTTVALDPGPRPQHGAGVLGQPGSPQACPGGRRRTGRRPRQTGAREGAVGPLLRTQPAGPIDGVPGIQSPNEAQRHEHLRRTRGAGVARRLPGAVAALGLPDGLPGPVHRRAHRAELRCAPIRSIGGAQRLRTKSCACHGRS